MRTLASAFAINPATVSKAYELLRTEGLVVTNAKSGTAISPAPAADRHSTAHWEERLRILLAEALAHGRTEQSILDSAARCLDTLSPRGQKALMLALTLTLGTASLVIGVALGATPSMSRDTTPCGSEACSTSIRRIPRSSCPSEPASAPPSTSGTPWEGLSAR